MIMIGFGMHITHCAILGNQKYIQLMDLFPGNDLDNLAFH